MAKKSKSKVPTKRCVVCNMVIPPERVEALPDTETCVQHSQVRPLTDADVDVDGDNAEDLRGGFY